MDARDVQVFQQGTAIGGLLRNQKRILGPVAPGKSATVIVDNAKVVRDLWLDNQRQERIGEDRAVYQEKRVSRASHLIFNFRPVQSRAQHLSLRSFRS
jgi:hypothetical protein